MNTTTRKDALGLPRLPYSYNVQKFRNCSVESSRDWQEINFWLGLYDGDPILQECQLNHLSSCYESDKSHWHDVAMKRAEQLQKTYEEIQRFGYPVTQDMRIIGNSRYPEFQNNTVSNTPKTTVSINSYSSENRQDRIGQCEMFLQYLIKFPYQTVKNTYDSMLANLDNPSEFARLRSQFKRNISQLKMRKDCKD